MRQVILIDDNGQRHDITNAVREKMGDMLQQGQPSAQPMQHRHMPGMEHAVPMPPGMTPDDFADNQDVRFIPIPAPMPNMNPQARMPQRPMMEGVQRPMMHMPRRPAMPEHMPNYRHAQMRGAQPQMPNARHGRMFNGGMPQGMFKRPIPSPEMVNPYYRTYGGNMYDEEQY